MNNALKLLEAIGQIQDADILDAHADIAKPAPSRRKIILIAAATAILLLLAGCAAYAYHWYAAYFSMQREQPLSDSQISYINENVQDIQESQASGGCTIELKSALAEGTRAYITLGLSVPEDVDLTNLKDGEMLRFGDLDAIPEGSELPAWASYQIMDDGDGKNHTVNVVMEIQPGRFLSEEEVTFGSGSTWKIVLQDILVDSWDEEYRQELLRTKYAGVTDFMFTEEEAARMHSQETLVSGKWEFEVELIADTNYLEFLTEPLLTKALVTRKNLAHYFDTKDAVEDITITSIQLRTLGATVTFEKPKDLEGGDFPGYHNTWIDMGDMYNSLTKLVNGDENFFVVLKDGTRIDFWQGEGAIGTAYLKADSPIVLAEVDYLQLSDGTKLYTPGA